MDIQKKRKGVAALLAATLLWATTFVMMKSAMEEVPTLWVIALRFAGAAVMLAAVAGKRLKKLDKGTVIGGAKMGVFLFLAYWLQNIGLTLIEPGKNAFLLTGYTVLTPFVAWAWNSTRPDRFNLIAAAMCFCGMGLASFGSDLSIGKGELITISSGFFYALHIVCSGRETQGRDTLLISFMQMVTIAALSFALMPIFSEFPRDVRPSTWLNIAYLSVICTGLCFLLQAYGQKYTPPMEVSIILPFESVFGALFSIALGETVTAREGIGYCLMFFAALVSEVRPGGKMPDSGPDGAVVER